jgi:hypothetical protein
MKLLIPIVCLTGVLFAQPPAANKSIAVEQAVPFGTAPGKLLLLGSYLVFFDEQQPEASYVVAKSIIETLTAEGSTITVRTRESVRNRAGEVRNLSFRVSAGSDPGPVTAWFGTPLPTNGAAPLTSGVKPPDAGTYQARHSHRIGGCTGRLLIGPDLLSYESIDDVGHSRRWEYKSIKEIKHPNPYAIEIKPFEGGGYDLKLEGSGMDPAAFKQLVDRVTNARSGR